ncbi:jg17322 [Pararge aegeria aegeria]|uniref:Peroxin-7 n=1 Tax=Pararge aegeria aegeria TaxID=348720 RepID=A0A8S4SKS9_9NEOP|nr:jg17322 [Pararge aegeria aegeria]
MNSSLISYPQTWSGTADGVAACGAGDGAVIVWRGGCAAPLRVLRAHLSEVCSVDWPRAHLLSASWDTTVKLWDPEAEVCLSTFAGHSQLVLSCDWSRMETHALATAGSDGLIRGWDLRRLTSPMFTLKGCECAVRRVQFSPHAPSVIAAVSYDFTTRIWDLKRGCDPLETIRHHSEFTVRYGYMETGYGKKEKVWRYLEY